MTVTRNELDKLFLDLLAYTDLDKVADTIHLFIGKDIEPQEVLNDIKALYYNLCQDIADRELSKEDLPIGHGRYGMMLTFTGGDPILTLTYDIAEAYTEE